MAQRILALGPYNKLLTIKKTVWFGLVTRRLLLKKVTQNSPKSCPAESAECSFFLEPGFEEFCPFLCSLVVQKLSCPLKSSDNSKPFATFFLHRVVPRCTATTFNGGACATSLESNKRERNAQGYLALLEYTTCTTKTLRTLTNYCNDCFALDQLD